MSRKIDELGLWPLWGFLAAFYLLVGGFDIPLLSLVFGVHSGIRLMKTLYYLAGIH